MKVVKLSVIIPLVFVLFSTLICTEANALQKTSYQKSKVFRAAKPNADFKDEVASLALSRDGNLFAVGFWNGDINVWRVSDSNVTKELKGHTDKVDILIFSPDDKRLLSASGSTLDYSLREWDPSTGKLLQTIPIQGIPDAIIFSQDGKKFAINGWDVLSVFAYDGGIRSLIMEFSFDSKHSPVAPIAFDSSGEVVFMNNGQAIDIPSQTISKKYSPDDLANVSSPSVPEISRNGLDFYRVKNERITGLAYDPVQRNVVIGTSAGEIKVFYGVQQKP